VVRVLAVVAITALTLPAIAQDNPTRPIRVIARHCKLPHLYETSSGALRAALFAEPRQTA